MTDGRSSRPPRRASRYTVRRICCPASCEQQIRLSVLPVCPRVRSNPRYSKRCRANFRSSRNRSDYIQMNSPFMDRKVWGAEVTKMIKVFGAPVSDEDAKTIIEYLTKDHGKPG